MNTQRQQAVLSYLKRQQKSIRALIMANVALGVLNVVITIGQMALLAFILSELIAFERIPANFYLLLTALVVLFLSKSVIFSLRERLGFQSGRRVRKNIREQIIAQMIARGALGINDRAQGSWAVMLFEQVENLHHYYARYLPQQMLSALVPLIIMLAVLFYNWAAAVILMLTLPLLPLFMVLIGMKTAEVNQRHIGILSQLSGQFLDTLRGFETISLFNTGKRQQQHLSEANQQFRHSTMEVLKYAFLSSAVLEFFASINIAIMAVYFGFIYLGQLDFGYYGEGVSLCVGLFCLMLAPEFYQPLRELGAFYHDKSAAIGSADEIEKFLSADHKTLSFGNKKISLESLSIIACDLQILSHQQQKLTEPLTFEIADLKQLVIIGESGSGKTTFINLLLGFLPYSGSIKLNGVELRELDMSHFRGQITALSQNPQLMASSIRENICFGNDVSDSELKAVIKRSNCDDFVQKLSLDYCLHEGNIGISGGQAQRLAIARSMLKNAKLVLLDEPLASLDQASQQALMQGIASLIADRMSIMITHNLEYLKPEDKIMIMSKGQIITIDSLQAVQKSEKFAPYIDQARRKL